ncbi:MAG TPA: DJ-1/PfpI family protein [Sedimentibacter sp.]|nr:DJ-1/PfpI family protein [Sedimentibacter sp.]
MINAGILVFDNLEELDFIGPFEVLSYVNKIKPDSLNVWLISADEKNIQGYNGLRFITDYTIDDCPPLDVLVVPGGQGRKTAMKNTKILNFIQSRYNELKYLSSVCTGSFIIAAAGLLKDRHATTYHTALDELSGMGVIVEKSKVVQDGKIITGAGVSSGIDVGLYLISKLFDEATAQETADKIEYVWCKQFTCYS